MALNVIEKLATEICKLVQFHCIRADGSYVNYIIPQETFAVTLALARDSKGSASITCVKANSLRVAFLFAVS